MTNRKRYVTNANVTSTTTAAFSNQQVQQQSVNTAAVATTDGSGTAQAATISPTDTMTQDSTNTAAATTTTTTAAIISMTTDDTIPSAGATAAPETTSYVPAAAATTNGSSDNYGTTAAAVPTTDTINSATENTFTTKSQDDLIPTTTTFNSGSSTIIAINQQTNTINTPYFSSVTASSSLPTTMGTNAFASTSNNLSSGKIAGIVVGIIMFLALIGAYLCIRKIRKRNTNTAKYASRRISPFNYITDEQKPENIEGEGKQPVTNNDNTIQINQEQQHEHQKSSSVYNEDTNEDNLYYCNSTDYHRSSFGTSTSTIQDNNSRSEMLPATTAAEFMLSAPPELYTHNSINSFSNNNMATTNALNPPYNNINKRNTDYNTCLSPTSTNSNTSNRSSMLYNNNNSRFSFGTQMYRTLSSTSALTNISSSNKNSFVSSTNPYYDSFGVISHQQRKNKASYRPLLHDSMFLNGGGGENSAVISRYPSTNTNTNTTRFSYHQRKESNLDPQILGNNKMALWDDHIFT